MNRRKQKKKGLGDAVHSITKAVGIQKTIRFFNDGQDCQACENRREKLNKLFRGRKTKELTEDEYNILKGIIQVGKNKISTIEQAEMLKIYNRIFNQKRKQSTCSPCVKSIYNELEKVYNIYIPE